MHEYAHTAMHARKRASGASGAEGRRGGGAEGYSGQIYSFEPEPRFVKYFSYLANTTLYAVAPSRHRAIAPSPHRAIAPSPHRPIVASIDIVGCLSTCRWVFIDNDRHL